MELQKDELKKKVMQVLTMYDSMSKEMIHFHLIRERDFDCSKESVSETVNVLVRDGVLFGAFEGLCPLTNKVSVFYSKDAIRFKKKG